MSPSDESYIEVQMEAMEQALQRVEDEDLAQRLEEARPQLQAVRQRIERVVELRRAKGKDMSPMMRMLTEWMYEELEQMVATLVELYGPEVLER